MHVPTFKEIRPFLDQIARYSICFKETLDYENYKSFANIPSEYDDLFVYGIGMLNTEFMESDDGRIFGNGDDPENDGKIVFLEAIEIVLSKEPREDITNEY